MRITAVLLALTTAACVHSKPPAYIANAGAVVLGSGMAAYAFTKQCPTSRFDLGCDIGLQEGKVFSVSLAVIGVAGLVYTALAPAPSEAEH